MSHIAISGPAKPKKFEGPLLEEIAQDFESRITDDDFIYCGGAYGIDTLCAIIARAVGARLILIVPKDLYYNRGLRSIANEVLEIPGSYLDRNSRLAETANELIAYPKTAEEELRSGTWSTIRRFRDRDKPVEIVPLDQFKGTL